MRFPGAGAQRGSPGFVPGEGGCTGDGSQEELLRRVGCVGKRDRRRDPEGVPTAGEEVPSRCEPRGQGGGKPFKGDQRGERGPFRQEETGGIRRGTEGGLRRGIPGGRTVPWGGRFRFRPQGVSPGGGGRPRGGIRRPFSGRG